MINRANVDAWPKPLCVEDLEGRKPMETIGVVRDGDVFLPTGEMSELEIARRVIKLIRQFTYLTGLNAAQHKAALIDLSLAYFRRFPDTPEDAARPADTADAVSCLIQTASAVKPRD